VVGDGGAGPAGGGRLDRSVDEIAEVGGFIAAGEGGLFDRTDGLAGWQQAKVVEVGDGVLGGNLGRPAGQQRLRDAAVEDRGDAGELAALPAVDAVPVRAGGGLGWGGHEPRPPR
jgi:hypothetical protein